MYGASFSQKCKTEILKEKSNKTFSGLMKLTKIQKYIFKSIYFLLSDALSYTK